MSGGAPRLRPSGIDSTSCARSSSTARSGNASRLTAHVDVAGRDDVHPDPVRAELHRRDLRQRLERRLRRRVGAAQRPRALDRAGGDVDDAAASAAVDAVPGERLDRAERAGDVDVEDPPPLVDRHARRSPRRGTTAASLTRMSSCAEALHGLLDGARGDRRDRRRHRRSSARASLATRGVARTRSRIATRAPSSSSAGDDRPARARSSRRSREPSGPRTDPIDTTAPVPRPAQRRQSRLRSVRIHHVRAHRRASALSSTSSEERRGSTASSVWGRG